MRIELSMHHSEHTDMEIKKEIKSVLETGLNIQEISVFPYNIKSVKRTIKKHTDITLSSPIDFPLGVSDKESRLNQCAYAISAGVQKIDIMAPSALIVNKKYDQMREEIAEITELCTSENIKYSYMLEYRMFTHSCLQRICKMLKTLGINTIYPSSGYMLDNIIDNTIASVYLTQKAGMKTVINGDIWTIAQADKIIKQKPYGIRLKTIHSARVLQDALRQK